MLQRVGGKVKLWMNKGLFNKSENQIPEETESWDNVSQHNFVQAPGPSVSSMDNFKKIARVLFL